MKSDHTLFLCYCTIGEIGAGTQDQVRWASIPSSVMIHPRILIFRCLHPLSSQNLTVCRVVSGLLFYFALSTAFWLVCDVGALAYMATKAVLRLPLVSYILIFIVGWGEAVCVCVHACVCACTCVCLGGGREVWQCLKWPVWCVVLSVRCVKRSVTESDGSTTEVCEVWCDV